MRLSPRRPRGAKNFSFGAASASGRGVHRLSTPLLTAALLVACNGPPEEVVIETRVGDPQLQAEPQVHDVDDVVARLRLYASVGDRWWTEHRARSDAAREAVLAASSPDAHAHANGPPAAVEPPTGADTLRDQIESIREADLDEVGAAVRNLAEADPALWPEVRAALLDPRERPKREYIQVLSVIGGDVPNRYGHFALHWKKAHGYDVRLSEDWYEDLLALEPARISKLLRPVYRDLLLTCALLEAASKAARERPEITDDVVAALLDAAYMHEGTFRDEVGRAIDAIGDPAVPHLMRESIPPEDEPDDSVPAKRAEYAIYCLDRMDRLHPRRAFEAVAGDRRLLADVLAAAGEVKDGEAAPLLLDYVDDNQPGIREAARDSFEAFVVGPLPKTRRKSIRLLNGATTTTRAELSYREHARLAIRARLEAEAPELLEEPCRLIHEGGIVDADCEGQPERLYRAYIASLDEARTARRDALIGRALSTDDHLAGAAMLDTLLTNGDAIGSQGPDLLAPYYAEVAAEVADDDPARAAQLLRKSALLLTSADPQRARELTIDALVLESTVEGLDRDGREMLLATAHELDPDEPNVQAALGRLESERERASGALARQLGLYLLGLFAVLALLAALGTRLHRERDPQPAS